jgi:flagellar protein FlaI
MGEVRGEEGRTLFQVMSTGHTTLTTFHADSVGEVIKRFTTDPINVSKTMFTALDLVSIQTQTRVGGRKVRRNRGLTDVNYYDPEDDEINVQDVFEWRAESDEFDQLTRSNKLADIKFDRGWDDERLDRELFQRKVVLAYLIDNGLNEYADVAATVQAFINDPDTILALIARDQLERSLTDLRGMESVMIDVDPEKEALVPRPEPGENATTAVKRVLARAEETLLPEYETREPSPLVSAIPDASNADVRAESDVSTSVAGRETEAEDRGDTEASTQGIDVPEATPPLESGQQPPDRGDNDSGAPVPRDGDWFTGRVDRLEAETGDADSGGS